MKSTILVTGGAGFIGSNLVHYCLEHNDFTLINLDKLTYAGNPESLGSVSNHPRHVFIQGDICDRNLLKKLFQSYQPRAVMHLAAESHVDRSIEVPGEFIQTNIVGTFQLLEAARGYWTALPEERKGSFRFLHISTDEVYGALGSEGYFTEESRYQPSSPYSASKASSDHLVRAYYHTYGMPTLITNCSNNYGPRQFPEKLIPLMILNALEGRELPVYGDGQNVRDWLYVEDHCRALLKVLAGGRPGKLTISVGITKRATWMSFRPSAAFWMRSSHVRAGNLTGNRLCSLRIGRVMISGTRLMPQKSSRFWIGSRRKILKVDCAGP